MIKKTMTTVIRSGADAALDISKIPESEMVHLARATAQAVKRYFEIPGVKEDYEKWLVEYKKKENERA